MKGTSVHRKNEGSAIILVVGVLAFFLIFFFVVGIDYAYVYVAKGELQNAADAAALAGAALLDGTSDSVAQTEAREEAVAFALENSTARLPVELALNTDNDPTGDIVVGNWDGSVFQPAADDGTGIGFPINALKVVARRTKERGNAVPLFFGGIVGGEIGRDGMDISRVAIARKVSKGVSPIIVNEYWQGDPGGGSGGPPCGEYPHSYFRSTNVDGNPSACFGEILALAGASATPNNTPSDAGGYVAFGYRTDSYDGYDVYPGNWYPNSGPSSPDLDLWVEHLDYYPGDPLVTYPESYLPNYNLPEPGGAPPDWKIYDGDGNRLYDNPISTYPYSTVRYYGGASTGQTIGPMMDGGAYRGGRYAPGSEIIVMVYDGLVWTGSPMSATRTTVVGYARVEIVGYGTSMSDAINNPDGPGVNTVYGYAVSELEECGTLEECRELIDTLSGDEVAVLVK